MRQTMERMGRSMSLQKADGEEAIPTEEDEAPALQPQPVPQCTPNGILY